MPPDDTHPDRELVAALAKLMRVARPVDPEIDLLLHDIARMLEHMCADQPNAPIAMTVAACRPGFAAADDNRPA